MNESLISTESLINWSTLLSLSRALSFSTLHHIKYIIAIHPTSSFIIIIAVISCCVATPVVALVMVTMAGVAAA